MKKHNYQQVSFFTTVNDLGSVPTESIKEVAIVGRSNSGKSSLINTLTNKTRLAFTSKTPGRTQHINYFSLENEEGVFLVDLPGYGFAQVPEKIRAHWIEMLSGYLQTRKPLVALVIIMDSRHPLRELDYKMLEFFSITGKPIHIVLSKVDKLNQTEKAKCLALVKSELLKEGYNNYTVQLFSSPKRIGIEELEQTLDRLFN
jgi:GTP-binding protein